MDTFVQKEFCVVPVPFDTINGTPEEPLQRIDIRTVRGATDDGEITGVHW